MSHWSWKRRSEKRDWDVMRKGRRGGEDRGRSRRRDSSIRGRGHPPPSSRHLCGSPTFNKRRTSFLIPRDFHFSSPFNPFSEFGGFEVESNNKKEQTTAGHRRCGDKGAYLGEVLLGTKGSTGIQKKKGSREGGGSKEEEKGVAKVLH